MPDIRSTGFLSTFDDPPETPLRESGRWAPVYETVAIGGSWILDMRKTGGVATDIPHSADIGGYIAYSYWTQERWSGDVEVWGIAGGGQLGASLETWRLFMMESLRPFRGYLVYFGGGLSKDAVIRRYDDDIIAGAAWAAPADTYYPGYALLRTNGDAVELWYTGWSDLDPNNMQPILSVNDASYRGPFWLGMGIEDPTVGGLYWTAFGGGVRNNTQIYRLLLTPEDGL